VSAILKESSHACTTEKQQVQDAGMFNYFAYSLSDKSGAAIISPGSLALQWNLSLINTYLCHPQQQMICWQCGQDNHLHKAFKAS
jgi:hypothetical protein